MACASCATPRAAACTTVLAELAESARFGIEVEETAIPVVCGRAVGLRAAGYDPLVLANEGKMVLVVAPERAAALLSALQAHPLGRQAQRIGAVTAEHPGRVVLRTSSARAACSTCP